MNLMWILFLLLNNSIVNIFRLPKKCKYGKNGCDFEQMPSRKQVVDEHEIVCPHRDVICFHTHCSNIVSLAKLLNHMKTTPHHKAPIGGQDSSCTRKFTVTSQNFPNSGWISCNPIHLTLNNQKEFYVQIVRSPSGLFYIWVYIIGTPKEEEDFTYTISLFDINKVYLFKYLSLMNNI